MRKNIFLAFLSCIIIALAGWWFYQSQHEQSTRVSQKCLEQYPFISTDIDCENFNDKIDRVTNLGDKIETIAKFNKESRSADEISVFFRDLNSRRWFGIEENANFFPASLAKLPLAMMYYKAAEVNRNILNASLSITEQDLQIAEKQRYKPESLLEAGKSYSIKDLIHQMLVESDNSPVRALDSASEAFRESVFIDLGILSPAKEDGSAGDWNVNTKSYANLFRILYNASYITPTYSNELLETLSEAKFKQALVAGVPSNTKVAHKFGEAWDIDATTGKDIVILHDCGIIYKKDNPYILCIMTKGENINELTQIISTISKTVYQSL